MTVSDKHEMGNQQDGRCNSVNPQRLSTFAIDNRHKSYQWLMYSTYSPFIEFRDMFYQNPERDIRNSYLQHLYFEGYPSSGQE